MILTADDAKKRLTQELELRTFDDRYLDRSEEREVLKIALLIGVGAEDAANLLAGICSERNYVRESQVVQAIKDHLDTSLKGDRRVDRKEFEHIGHGGNRQQQRQTRLVPELVCRDQDGTRHRLTAIS
jgi:hypothetical protein